MWSVHRLPHPYFRILAFAPAMICMATPAIQPIKASQVQADVARAAAR